jgi:choline dehydrogenase-like flavoprotein
VDIDPEVKDIYGIPAVRVHFQWGPNELMMWDQGKEVCSSVIKASGGEVWGVGEKPNTPGYSLHETGTCRMGDDPKHFVTNRFGRTHDVPNLYVCDASVFLSCTDKTTTLSILASSLRTSEYLSRICARAAREPKSSSTRGSGPVTLHLNEFGVMRNWLGSTASHARASRRGDFSFR